jgi:hypothetical protein
MVECIIIIVKRAATGFGETAGARGTAAGAVGLAKKFTVFSSRGAKAVPTV